jgi:hypothetical protein
MPSPLWLQATAGIWWLFGARTPGMVCQGPSVKTRSADLLFTEAAPALNIVGVTIGPHMIPVQLIRVFEVTITNSCG